VVRAKKRKRGKGERRKGNSPLPLFLFFALAPTVAGLKHRNLPQKRLLLRLGRNGVLLLRGNFTCI